MAKQEINPAEIRDELFKVKAEFSQKALDECLTFLKHDNKIIGHFEKIMEAVKDDIQKNPNKFYSNQTSNFEGMEGYSDIEGSGFLSGLGDFIKEVIIKDKDLIVSIIGKVFGL